MKSRSSRGIAVAPPVDQFSVGEQIGRPVRDHAGPTLRRRRASRAGRLPRDQTVEHTVNHLHVINLAPDAAIINNDRSGVPGQLGLDVIRDAEVSGRHLGRSIIFATFTLVCDSRNTHVHAHGSSTLMHETGRIVWFYGFSRISFCNPRSHEID